MFRCGLFDFVMLPSAVVENHSVYMNENNESNDVIDNRQRNRIGDEWEPWTCECTHQCVARLSASVVVFFERR